MTMVMISARNKSSSTGYKLQQRSRRPYDLQGIIKTFLVIAVATILLVMTARGAIRRGSIRGTRVGSRVVPLPDLDVLVGERAMEATTTHGGANGHELGDASLKTFKITRSDGTVYHHKTTDGRDTGNL